MEFWNDGRTGRSAAPTTLRHGEKKDAGNGRTPDGRRRGTSSGGCAATFPKRGRLTEWPPGLERERLGTGME